MLTMKAAADLIRATVINRVVTETIPHSPSNHLGATRRRQRNRRKTRFSAPMNREPIRAPLVRSPPATVGARYFF
jgi:hypothetical protein